MAKQSIPLRLFLSSYLMLTLAPFSLSLWICKLKGNGQLVQLDIVFYWKYWNAKNQVPLRIFNICWGQTFLNEDFGFVCTISAILGSWLSSEPWCPHLSYPGGIIYTSSQACVRIKNVNFTVGQVEHGTVEMHVLFEFFLWDFKTLNKSPTICESMFFLTVSIGHSALQLSVGIITLIWGLCEELSGRVLKMPRATAATDYSLSMVLLLTHPYFNFLIILHSNIDYMTLYVPGEKNIN